MSWPSNVMVPALAGRVPASTAMKVDLPAPLGPIRPVIFPSGTSIDTPSTARMPSKWRCTSRATSMAPSGRPDTVDLLGIRASLEHAPRLGPHALGPKPQEPDDQEADRHPLQGRHETDLGRDSDRPELELVGNEASHLFESHRHEQRPEHRAHVVAAPADDDGGEQDDRLG